MRYWSILILFAIFFGELLNNRQSSGPIPIVVYNFDVTLGVLSLYHLHVVDHLAAVGIFLGEVLHNGKSGLPGLLSLLHSGEEMHISVGVLFLTLHHFNIAGHVLLLISAFLREFLHDSQRFILVLIVRGGSFYLNIIDISMALYEVDIGGTLLLCLFLREILNYSQRRFFIFLKLPQSRLLTFCLALALKSRLNGLINLIVDEDQVFLIVLISLLLEAQEGVRCRNGCLQHDQARRYKVQWV